MQSLELGALWKLIQFFNQFLCMWDIHIYSYIVTVTEIVFPMVFFCFVSRKVSIKSCHVAEVQQDLPEHLKTKNSVK